MSTSQQQSEREELGLESEPWVQLVTTDERLRDDIALIGAVVGARVQHATSWDQTEIADGAATLDPLNHQSPLAVLCSVEQLPVPAALGGSGPLAETEHMVVGYESASLWSAAAVHPGISPVPLPEGENWLSEYLTGAAMDRGRGVVCGFIGAAGGVGTTMWAYLCAAELAAVGHRVLLLDAVGGPSSGAVWLRDQLSQDHAVTTGGGGLGWQQLERTEGRISSAQLSSSLPDFDGVAILTDAFAKPETDQLRAALEAGRRAYDAVLIDCGVSSGPIRAVEEQVDTAAMVLRPSLRCFASAVELRSELPHTAMRLILNGAATTGITSADAPARTGLQVAADLAEQRWLRRSDDLVHAYELLRSRRGSRLVGSAITALGLV